MELEVFAIVDVGALLGVPVVTVAGRVVSIWVVSVFPSTLQVKMCIITAGTQQATAHVLTVPVFTSFTAGCRLMLGPLTAHTFTL